MGQLKSCVSNIRRNSLRWKYKLILGNLQMLGSPQNFAHQGCEEVFLNCVIWFPCEGCPCSAFHFFLSAFSAALVCLPSAALGVVALMTPTATVCLMSRTANLPRGGNSEKGSTHMGLLGVSMTIAASPDLMNLGLSSVDFPVRRSTFSLISAN